MEIQIDERFDDTDAAFLMAVREALETCGQVGEGYAKNLCPVDTGNLRNSITHQVDVDERCVLIGTNSEYAAYVEMGTGEYVPGGRQTPWSYQDDKGNWHNYSLLPINARNPVCALRTDRVL